MKTQNATSRGEGAIGPNALVPRKVEEWFGDVTQSLTVLDFGAGKKALHAFAMHKRHPDWTVHAWEDGENWSSEFHVSPFVLSDMIGEYDVAYASNVLNVQTTWQEVVQIVATLHGMIHHRGSVFVNLPINPRKAAWSHYRGSKGIEGRCERDEDWTALKALLSGFFARVNKVGGAAGAPVYLCSQKIQPGE